MGPWQVLPALRSRPRPGSTPPSMASRVILSCIFPAGEETGDKEWTRAFLLSGQPQPLYPVAPSCWGTLVLGASGPRSFADEVSMKSKQAPASWVTSPPSFHCPALPLAPLSSKLTRFRPCKTQDLCMTHACQLFDVAPNNADCLPCRASCPPFRGLSPEFPSCS